MSEQAPEKGGQPMTRRQLLKYAGVAVGGAVVGGTLWEGVRNPLLSYVSGEPRVIRPSWMERSDLGGVNWVSFAGDNDVSEDQKSWRRVGVAAVTQGVLSDLVNHTRSPNRVAAAAFQISGNLGKVTGLGDINNLGEVRDENFRYYAVGFMVGRGALNVALGALEPDGRFIPVYGNRPFATADIHDIAWKMPEVPVLRG